MIISDIKEEIIFMYYFSIIISVIIAYLIGSIPFGIIISKANEVDITKVGSGSPGYTNVKRALGFKWGALVFVLDFLKTVISIFISYYIAYKFSFTNISHIKNMTMLVGLASIIGHNYPIFNNFKGGKGITCSVAACFVFSPIWAIILFLIYFIVKNVFGYVSLGSIVALLAMFISSIVLSILHFYPFNYENSIYTIPIFFLICAINIYRHKSNIKRLIEGNENHI